MSKKVDTPTLKRIADRARRLGYSRLMSKAAEKCLDPVGMHLLTQPFIHGDVQCVRVRILAKMKDRNDPYEGVLDLNIDDFNRIPELN